MFWLLGGTLFLEMFSMSVFSICFFFFFFLNRLLKISETVVVYTHDL